jgi:short-subunit dehydrogenase
VFPVAADLTRPDEVESLARRAVEATGTVDVLVNNAGMAAMLPYERTAPEDIRREVAVNLTAPLVLTRLLLRGMLARGRGHIVNISSLSGEFPLPYHEAYCATKAGLILFAKSLRAEYRGTGVSASVLLPGVIRGAGAVRTFEEKSEFKMARLPFARGCRPEQVSRAVIRAIRHDVPEIVLNQPPLRPLLALFQLFPRLVDPVLRRAGVYRPIVDAVRANLAHGGRLTDVTVWPETERPDDQR